MKLPWARSPHILADETLITSAPALLVPSLDRAANALEAGDRLIQGDRVWLDAGRLALLVVDYDLAASQPPRAHRLDRIEHLLDRRLELQPGRRPVGAYSSPLFNTCQ